MAILVFVHQLADGAAATLSVCIGQSIEVSESLILKKYVCRHIFQNLSMVHYQGPAGQFFDEEYVVTDE